MHGVENQDSHAKMGVSLLVYICGCFVNGVCILGLGVVEACGGLQGFTENSVQSTTWEPGVEGYLAMGKSLHNQSNRYARAVLGTCLFVASHCCDSDQG